MDSEVTVIRGGDDGVARLKALLEEKEATRPVLIGLDDAARGHFEAPYLPPSGFSAVAREYRALMERAELPICGLIIRAVVDRLSVEGVRGKDGQQDKELWSWWQRSRLDSRQGQLYSDAGIFGEGYLSVTLDDEGLPLLLPESPLSLYARHDPFDPLRVLEAVKLVGSEAWLYGLDDVKRFVKRRNTSQGWVQADIWEHGLGECLIVRFPNDLDSLGRSMSDIGVVLPFQKRINQSVFTRLLLEAHTAWRQRWVAGIDVEKDENGEAVPPFRMGVDKLLVAPDETTKFGEFEASSTADLLRAVEEDLRQVAIVTQTPPTLFAIASVSNISQESLAALEGGLTRKVESKQAALGESFEYAMQLAGRLVGVHVDEHLEMIWTNMELRSLSQRTDAFVKLQQAGLPVAYLMESLLDMSPTAIDRVLAATAAEESVRAVAQAQSFGVQGDNPELSGGGGEGGE